MPIFGSDHPETSITVKINQFTRSHDEVDDSLETRLTDLIELIKVQPNTGATEAARAIRKKIKYGQLKEQMLALKVLELLVINSGLKIGGIIANDDKLNQVLIGIIKGNGLNGNGQLYPKRVIQHTRALAIGWHEEFRDMANFKLMSDLYKYIPKSRLRKPNRENDRVFDDDEDEDAEENNDDAYDNERSSHRSRSARVVDDVDSGYSKSHSKLKIKSSSSRRSPPPPRPTSKSPFQKDDNEKEKQKQKKKNKNKNKNKKKSIIYADEQFQIPQINYTLEAPKIRSLIADCYTQLNKLDNSLTLLPADASPLDDKSLVKQFEKCKSIRHKVLKYLQFVGVGNEEDKSSETAALDMEFLGSLLMANEKLVEIFKKFDSKCGYNEYNKAPEYNNEVDSDESYYTSDEDEDEDDDDEDEDINQANDRLQNIILSKSPPPPIPQKPKALSKPLVKATTNSSDPFGDGNEVGNYSSKYD